MRAKNGVALMAKGTMAAHTPMVVPVTRRVNGISATSSTMKGVARKPLTTLPTARLMRGDAKNPPGAVTINNTASAMPTTSATPADTDTMASVSSNACV